MMDIAKLKILVVEDDDMNYIYLKQIFRILGSELIRVNLGKRAIEKCMEDNFDLVMMDIQLPDIDGFEVTRTIRTFNSSIPIIAQTASKSPDEHKKAMEAGCNNILLKPYKLDDVRAMLSGLNIE